MGYLDLNLLSKYDVQRRAELFCLSQPGGHPHNWKNVSTECLNLLRHLTDSIIEFNEKASVASVQAKQITATPLMKQKGADRTVL